MVTNPDWTTWVKDSAAQEDDFGGIGAGVGRAASRTGSAFYTGSTIHKSSSPEGPFEPVSNTSFRGCNNPSPFVMKNGTILVLCT